ncbi:MAG: ABC transporter ATP-binding protein, partial [Thermoanaerobacterales bacterium]|nr:ABC transporter ATP-binding protein [Thermoanaerobacterales bacterium]
LEIIRAMALNPKLLLMDEPAAGMNATEKQELKEYILKVVSEGISVLLIEHDMSFVLNICSKIVVLNFGKKIAEGVPREIQSNKDVMEAYLGRKEDAEG